jgi:hypothetical protein
MKIFIRKFNKIFEYVSLERFVFEESDYEYVSIKEVKEIQAIFKTFDITIKAMSPKK